ncbi:MAG: hypothetical protein GY820_27410 [Gammaproteobacteria bacterium]|nr:hypothetical protein [Gammaproteobacteria bacterium]
MMMHKAMESRVIQLEQLDEFPAYVAIYATSSTDHAFTLSPAAMRWSDSIVVNRLKDCEVFWTAQKHKNQCDYATLFEPILQHYFGDNFIAVFACHPWQCLLYLAYQLQQQAQGIYFLQSRLSQNIYRSLGWQYWFVNQSVLAGHLEAIHARGFNATQFRARQACLKRFIKRIGVAGPFEMKQVDYQAFRRRFETWLANIWAWSNTQSSELQGFPWVALQPAEPVIIERDLEYPLNQWQFVAVLLREDLMRLDKSFGQNDQLHINRLVWRIRLFNHQLVEVALAFRQPYSLRRDTPEFNTALYQARFIYDALIRKLQQRDKNLDLPETMPLISWCIEVCESFELPPMIWDLFTTHNAGVANEALLSLQNKLPIRIDCYGFEPSFCPEQSFSDLSICTEYAAQPDDHLWTSHSKQRPLFCYPAVQALEVIDNCQLDLLERCADDWWRQEDTSGINRDYFLYKDKRGRASWVYRNSNGSWFKQGEYH